MPLTAQSARIGEPLRRKEDFRLITGSGCFSDDVNLPQQVFAIMVRSPHAHARIVSIDVSAALASPGVFADILREGEGAVRLNLIQASLGLPRQSIEMFESDFIRLGLISKSEKGRMLTAKGFEHLAATTR